MDFFDMVPDNFFSLLASKNKRIYLSSILQVFKVYETGTILGIDKKIVVDDLAYFLETNKNYLFDAEDEEDEESNPTNKRDLANYILRRMEECGWIYIDVTNDYIEVLNFSDDAIIICEALINAYPQFEYSSDELPADFINPNEYHGYIYSINSLLSQTDDVDYALTFSLVYSNTKQLIRALRRMDARMKDYITSVVENTDIKNLMEKLIAYKNDIYDTSYTKLKISDNIDRYRLSIITRLEEMQTNESIVNAISKNYLPFVKTTDQAVDRAIRQIDEVIDAFNAIQDFVVEIDNKNKNYINSTIGKIKFLLTEEDNVVGKLNTILKYVKDSNKAGKIDKALRLVDGLYELPVLKIIDGTNSLYAPRGSYTRNYNQMLDDFGIAGFEMTDEFMNQFKNLYNEDEIKAFVEANMESGLFKASSMLNYDSTREELIMVIYSIIYASEHKFVITIFDDFVTTKDYMIRNFEIKKAL
ncbi:MAG: hypothetical protein IKP77_02660 [Acholeplasmatales bacterium]|nr:hypothetical protein [Acholeplasmatales bacterium]